MELETWIKQIEEEGLMQAPDNLKEDIFAAIEIEREERLRRKKQNLQLYTWEVRLITAAAVLILFLLPGIHEQRIKQSMEDYEERKPSVVEMVGDKSDEICGKIFQLSNRLIRMNFTEKEEDAK